MNAHHDNELEARIDRELKSLPPLAAPETLAPRVMAAIALRAGVPWHRRAWQTWPMALRTASLVVLLALFGGICLAGWQVSHAPGVTEATQKVSGGLAIANLVWKTLGVLGDAAALAVQHMGTGFMVALVAAIMLGYAACVALGSACYRLAYARR